MEEYLPFVSIDTWTIIMSWGNLLILFLLLKFFLFKPVGKVLDARAEEIEETYKSAEDTKSAAEKMLGEYEEKLKNAHDTADGIIKSAQKTADMRSENIVNDANDKARRIMEKSRAQIERDKQEAVRAARYDIAKAASAIAEKLIGRELTADDDEKLIGDIIDRM